jgi:hypothetical protein
MTNQRLQKRQQRRRDNLVILRDENVRLKKIVARLQRKIEHGCSDASCSLCDVEKPEDGTWEFA